MYGKLVSKKDDKQRPWKPKQRITGLRVYKCKSWGIIYPSLKECNTHYRAELVSWQKEKKKMRLSNPWKASHLRWKCKRHNKKEYKNSRTLAGAGTKEEWGKHEGSNTPALSPISLRINATTYPGQVPLTFIKERLLILVCCSAQFAAAISNYIYSALFHCVHGSSKLCF